MSQIAQLRPLNIVVRKSSRTKGVPPYARFTKPLAIVVRLWDNQSCTLQMVKRQEQLLFERSLQNELVGDRPENPDQPWHRL